VRKTVRVEDVEFHEQWNAKYGAKSCELEEDDGHW